MSNCVFLCPPAFMHHHGQAINFSQCAKLQGDISKASQGWLRAQELRFVNCPLLEGDLSCLALLQALTTVEFHECAKLTGSFANAFPASPSSTTTAATDSNDEGMRGNIVAIDANGHLHLRVLSFKNCPSLECSLEDLSHLTALRQLEMSQCSHVKGDLQHLTRLVELRMLSLQQCERLRGDLVSLARCTQLEKASFRGCSIHGNLRTIAHWPNLEMLDCRGCLVAAPDGCPRGAERDLNYGTRSACLELGAWIRTETNSGVITGRDKGNGMGSSSKRGSNGKQKAPVA